MKILITMITALMAVTLHAQERVLIEPEEWLMDVSESISSEDYERALEELSKIRPHDSLYESILTERSALLQALERWDESIEVCNEGIALNGEYAHEFYQNKAYCLIEQGKYDEAIDVNSKGARNHPKYTALRYNSAYAHVRNGDLQQAKRAFQDLIAENKLYRDSHLELAKLAIRDNDKVRMLLCLNTYMLTRPPTEIGGNVLGATDEWCASGNDSVAINLFADDTENFDQIELILDNKVALDSKYKTGVDVRVNLISQNHALFTQLAQGAFQEGGFWTDNYVPIYKAIIDEGQFENYSWFLLSYADNESLMKKVKKHGSDIERFNNWWENYVAEHWNSFPHPDHSDGRSLVLFNDQFDIQTEGQIKTATGSAFGTWNYYDEAGRLSTEGNFADNERDGSWKWFYASGALDTEANYSKGKMNGTRKTYFPDGTLSSQGSFEDDQPVGDYHTYFENGQLKDMYRFESGKLSGTELYYYANGQLKDSLNWIEGKLSGPYIQYHPSGKLMTQGALKDGKRHGTIVEYYPNGKIKNSNVYVDGYSTGMSEDYYPNGQLSYQGRFEKDYRVGEHKEFYSDGTVSSVTNYDESGKQNGNRTYFDHQGRKNETQEYARGNVVSYQFFDQEGNVLHQAKKKGNQFVYKGFDFHGNIKSEGLFNIKGGKEGEWEYWNSKGQLSSKANYVENIPQGRQTYFHPNGQTSSEYDMVDGEYDNEHRSYHLSGALKRHGMFDEGNQIGTWYAYDPDGQLTGLDYFIDDEFAYSCNFDAHGVKTDEKFYTNGLIDSTYHYGANGQVVDIVRFKGGSGIDEYRHENGQTQYRCERIYGEYDGPATIFNGNGKVHVTGQYIFGDRHGEWKWHYPNGNPASKNTYEYGLLHGEFERYYWDGASSYQGQYEFGDKTGEWISYYPDGTIESRTPYRFDEINGDRYNYSPGGDLQMIRRYEDGHLVSYSYHGADGTPVDYKEVDYSNAHLIAYYPNGTKSREYKLEKGNVQGTFYEYLTDGRISYAGDYLDGELHGKVKHYDKDGNIYKEEDYILGDRHGHYIEYRPDGSMIRDIPYHHDSRSGTGYEYDAQGNVLVTYEFRDNLLVDEKK